MGKFKDSVTCSGSIKRFIILVLCELAGLVGIYYARSPWLSYNFNKIKQELYTNSDRVSTFLAQVSEQLASIGSSAANLDIIQRNQALEPGDESPTVQNVPDNIFTTVLLVNTDGFLLATYGKPGNQQDNYFNVYHQTPETNVLQEAAMTSGISYSSIYEGSQGTPSIIVAMPIIQHEKIVGFIAGDCLLTALLQQFETYNSMHNPRRLIFGYNHNFKQVFLVAKETSPSFDQGLSHALLGTTDSNLCTDDQQNTSLAAWKYIPHLRAGLVVEYPLSRCMLPFDIFFYVLMVLISITLVMVGCCIFMQRAVLLDNIKTTCSGICNRVQENPRIYLLVINAFVLGCSILGFLSLLLYYHKQVFMVQQNRIIDEKLQTQYTVHKIDTDMQTLVEIATRIASLMPQHSLDTVSSYVADAFTTCSHLSGVIVSFAPYKYQSSTRLYAQLWQKTKDKISQQRIDQLYDYTAPDEDTPYSTLWYSEPISNNGPLWVNNTLEELMKESSAAYAVPFYDAQDLNHNDPLGVIVALSPLIHIYREISSFEHLTQGKSFLVNAHGRFLYYPNKDIDLLEKKIFEFTTPRDAKSMLLMRHLTECAGKTYARLSLETMHATDWFMGVMFPKEPTYAYQKSYLKELLLLTLFCALILISLGFLVLSVHSLYRPITWSIMRAALLHWYVVVLCCANGIAWYIIYNDPLDVGQQEIIVNGTEGLSKVVNATTPSESKTYKFRPTGFSVSELDFAPEGTIALHTRIWQVCNGVFCKQGASPSKLPFIIKNAIKTNITFIAHELQDGNECRTIWDCNAVLPTYCQKWRYPLQRYHVMLELEQTEGYGATLPTPDFETFETIVDRQYPWIEAEASFKQQEYFILTSFFGYHLERHTLESSPTLNLHVIAQLNILDELLTFAIPLFFIFFTIFAALWLSKGYGITICSSLAFTTVLLHNGSRGLWNQTSQTTFIEWFFIVIYITCLINVVFHTFLLVENKILQTWGERFIYLSKMLYWPFQLTLWFLITIILFLVKA